MATSGKNVFAFCVQEKSTRFSSGIGFQLPTALYHFMEKCHHAALQNGDDSFLATMDSEFPQGITHSVYSDAL
jgi:hypothetical protein